MRWMENEALTVQRDVLAALAEGTGGTFFHNSGDFADGPRQTVQAPEVYYVLSFSPRNVKLDGKFHALKVALNSGHGWDVLARRGVPESPPVFRFPLVSRGRHGGAAEIMPRPASPLLRLLRLDLLHVLHQIVDADGADIRV
jgi:hypothetical protein